MAERGQRKHRGPQDNKRTLAHYKGVLAGLERAQAMERSGGSRKPPKGKLCVQIAPYAAWPALLVLANAIWQSIV